MITARETLHTAKVESALKKVLRQKAPGTPLTENEILSTIRALWEERERASA